MIMVVKEARLLINFALNSDGDFCNLHQKFLVSHNYEISFDTLNQTKNRPRT